MKYPCNSPQPSSSPAPARPSISSIRVCVVWPQAHWGRCHWRNLGPGTLTLPNGARALVANVGAPSVYLCGAFLPQKRFLSLFSPCLHTDRHTEHTTMGTFQMKTSPGFSSRVREKFHRPAPLRVRHAHKEERERERKLTGEEVLCVCRGQKQKIRLCRQRKHPLDAQIAPGRPAAIAAQR